MRHIGHYQLLDRIGEGGMGTVYKARDPRFDRFVAIKVLDEKLQRVPGVADRFRTEAVIQAKLQHPHLVAVHDFIADDQVLAIVMELVDGRPLDHLIEQRRGALPVPWCITVISQVLSAVDLAHRQGLVHRDLKPSNILVADLRGEPFAKVTDFGIAKVVGTDKARTATGARMGTLSYMSPEHVRSPKLADARSDVYALGATLFEMLAGRVPYEGDSEFEVMQAIVHEPVPDLRALATSVPQGLCAVVARALQKDPGARFQSCEEMRQALWAAAPARDTGARLTEAWRTDTAAPTRQPRPVTPRPTPAPAPTAAQPTAREVMPSPPAPFPTAVLAWVGLPVLVVGLLAWAANSPRSSPGPSRTTSTPASSPVYTPPPRYDPPAPTYSSPAASPRAAPAPRAPAGPSAAELNAADLSAARALHDEGRYEDAMRRFDRVLQRDPGNRAARDGKVRADRARRAELETGLR